MQDIIQDVIYQMISYFGDDVKRINHALKVYGLAKNIAMIEGISDKKLFILEIASILHDIGIKESEKKYNSTAGKYQELEGPPIAEEFLQKYTLEEEMIERICFLIGNHHTYSKIDDIDFQVLVEADFLVNIFEDEMSVSTIRTIGEKYFKTSSGKNYLNQMFLETI